MAGVRLTDFKTGTNTITHSPGGVDVLRWSGAQAPVVALDLGMQSDGRIGLVVDSDQKQVAMQHDVRRAARVATLGGGNIANLAAGAPLVVGGITLVTGNIVFVSDQTDSAEHGPYRVVTPGSGADGAWVRASDGDHASDFVPGAEWYIEDGSNNGETLFRLVTTGTIILGTTALDFRQSGVMVRSDGSGVEVIASAALTADVFKAQTGSTDNRDFRDVNWWIECTALAAATTFTIKIEWSEDNAEFDDQKTGVTTAGAETLSNHTSVIDVTGLATPFVKHISLPTFGRRYSKVSIKSDTASTVSVKAQRGA